MLFFRGVCTTDQKSPLNADYKETSSYSSAGAIFAFFAELPERENLKIIISASWVIVWPYQMTVLLNGIRQDELDFY